MLTSFQSSKFVVGVGTYQVAKDDKFRVISFTNTAGCTVYVPPEVWDEDFWMGILQARGAGTVTIQAANGAAVDQRQSHTGTAGEGAFVAIIADASQRYLFWLVGDTA